MLEKVLGTSCMSQKAKHREGLSDETTKPDALSKQVWYGTDSSLLKGRGAYRRPFSGNSNVSTCTILKRDAIQRIFHTAEKISLFNFQISFSDSKTAVACLKYWLYGVKHYPINQQIR